jgi:hypothetical protein
MKTKLVQANDVIDFKKCARKEFLWRTCGRPSTDLRVGFFCVVSFYPYSSDKIEEGIAICMNKSARYLIFYRDGLSGDKRALAWSRAEAQKLSAENP